LEERAHGAGQRIAIFLVAACAGKSCAAALFWL